MSQEQIKKTKQNKQKIKTIASLILNDEKITAFLFGLRTAKMSTISAALKHYSGGSTQCNKARGAVRRENEGDKRS